MTVANILYSETFPLTEDAVKELYLANGWSSGEKPDRVLTAMRNSDCVLTASVSGRLIGLVNALSDKALVVYYPHLIVHPDFHGQGVGTALMRRMLAKYADMHQQMLVAEGPAVEFYRGLGFEPAEGTLAMWIYDRSADGASVPPQP